jgi:uncharacterized protein YaiI (UPF0178 family)
VNEVDTAARPQPAVYVDADACPVKEEIYRVALRHGLKVFLVANSGLRLPDRGDVELVVVDDGFDAADDWIVAQSCPDDLVVTTDIPLAARCLEKQARVLNPKGHIFTDASIGGALANREFLAQMREHGTMTGGPAPFTARDRSQFLQGFEQLIQQSLRSLARR